MTRFSPFALLLWLLGGLAISLVYDIAGTGIVWYLDGFPQAQLFFDAYTNSFKTLVSFGLVLGTTLILLRTQKVVQTTVERAFTKDQLLKTKYYIYRDHFWRRRKTMIFAGQLTIIGFVVFSSCKFPLTGSGEVLMMIAACGQYALGSFVGRKLMYTGMMLHSLTQVRVTRNLFAQRKLDDINIFVILASTLTIIFVYIHVLSYFNAPFLYDGPFEKSVKIFLAFPAVIATPVLLIFNFYPREVVRRLYDKSIKVELRNLRRYLRNETLSDYEKRSCLIEFDKMSREELRYRLQLTLSDLPFGITILIMVLEPLLK